MPSRTPNGGLEALGSPIAIPTKFPGEVYIPALGRSFQQIELRDLHLVFDAKDTRSGDPNYIFARGNGAPGRLTSGTEALVHSATWIPIPDDQSDDNIELKVNRRTPVSLPKPLLRAALQPHLPADHDWKNWVEKMLSVLTIDTRNDSPQADAFVRLISVLEHYHKLPRVGVQLQTFVQLRDNDDFNVRGLSSGIFILSGLQHLPLGM